MVCRQLGCNSVGATRMRARLGQWVVINFHLDYFSAWDFLLPSRGDEVSGVMARNLLYQVVAEALEFVVLAVLPLLSLRIDKILLASSVRLAINTPSLHLITIAITSLQPSRRTTFRNSANEGGNCILSAL